MTSALWPLLLGVLCPCRELLLPRFMRDMAFLNISLLKMLVISFWVAGSREQGLTTVLTGPPSTCGDNARVGRSNGGMPTQGAGRDNRKGLGRGQSEDVQAGSPSPPPPAAPYCPLTFTTASWVSASPWTSISVYLPGWATKWSRSSHLFLVFSQNFFLKSFFASSRQAKWFTLLWPTSPCKGQLSEVCTPKMFAGPWAGLMASEQLEMKWGRQQQWLFRYP